MPTSHSSHYSMKGVGMRTRFQLYSYGALTFAKHAAENSTPKV